MEKDITLLVNSCDKYKDAWLPFFTLFNVYFPNLDCKKILNAEKETCLINGVEVFNSNKKSWSKRLIEALNKIDTEYVLFMLEDFFLQEPVKQDIFYLHLDYIKEHKDVGVIYYIPHMDYNLWHTREYDKDNYLEEIIVGSPLRANAQTAIWKKEYLLKVLLSKEDPWSFEKYGSLRTNKLKEKVLSCYSNLWVFPYAVYMGSGYGINGKWHKRNKELFDKHGITVNFENLGWFDEEQFLKKVKVIKKSTYIKNPKLLFNRLKHKLKEKFPFLNI